MSHAISAASLSSARTDQAHSPRLLLGLLAMAALVFGWRLWFSSANGFSLFIDEAQYWQWAQAPAWGYYSKPPLVAWLIAASTSVCGNAESCVRLPALLAWPSTGVVVGLLAARLMRRAGHGALATRAGLVSGAVFMSMPGQALSGWILSPDAFLLLAWGLALLALLHALDNPQRRWPWLALGVALGLGTLAKYSMLMFLPGLFWLLALPEHRAHLRHAGPWLALAVLGVMLAPNILWNLQHGFETVRHTAELAGTSADGLFHPRHLLEFSIAQWAIFGLVSFPLLLGLLVKRDAHTRLLRPFVIPYLLAMSTLALVSNANPNWAAAIYVAGSVLVGMWLAQPQRSKWLAAALVLNVALTLAVMHARDIAPHFGVQAHKVNIFSRVEGWRELGAALQPVVGARAGVPVLASDRHLLSLLGYYLSPSPYPVRALDVDGRISHHYDLLARQHGLPQAALWVDDPQRPVPPQLAQHYSQLHELGVVGAAGGRQVRVIRVQGLRDAPSTQVAAP